MMHRATYNPFIHRCSVPPILGIESTITNSRLHHRKACGIRPGLQMRESNNPAKKGYNNRVNPIRSWVGSIAQPPITSPRVTASWISAHPNRKTKKARTFFENFLINKAYRILAMYSKKRDHVKTIERRRYRSGRATR